MSVTTACYYPSDPNRAATLAPPTASSTAPAAAASATPAPAGAGDTLQLGGAPSAPTAGAPTSNPTPSPGDRDAQAVQALVAAVGSAKGGNFLAAAAQFTEAANDAGTAYKAMDVAEEAHDLGYKLNAAFAFGKAADLAASAGDFNAAMDAARESSRLGYGASEAYALYRALGLCTRSDQAQEIYQLASKDQIPWVPDQAAQKVASLPQPTLWDHVQDWFGGLFGGGHYQRQYPANDPAHGSNATPPPAGSAPAGSSTAPAAASTSSKSGGWSLFGLHL